MWGVNDIHHEIQQKLESLQDIANVAKVEYRSFEEMKTLDASRNRPHSSFYEEERTIVAEPSQQTGFEINEIEGARTSIRSIDTRYGTISDTQIPKTLKGSRDFPSSLQPKIRSEKHRSTSVNGIEESSSSAEQHLTVLAKPRVGIRSSDPQPNMRNFLPHHYCECEPCQLKSSRTRCSAFLNEMIALNHRLISDVQEINYLARKWELKSSQREHWLVAASILDKAFFVAFLIFFVAYTMYNFGL